MPLTPDERRNEIAALTIHLFIAFRKRVREHVDQRLSETR